ncbi:hypothetical protein G6031_02745 [Dietzia sp. CQ4]|uniref:hypothetical protein n=1 Tax=Dietzia sp. (strain CQ4) TaxID=370437 RepID=UPI0015FBAE73|nr:hypothetical protein [Dietzia sp. CQ4]MBB1033306.1 hypothetical protein [Dietzia sp. CQ4]
MRSKKEAENAARGLLESKVALVGAIGQAIEEDQKAAQAVVDAQEAREAAEENIRRAFQAARDGGWSVEELKDLGYEPPRRRRRRKSSPGEQEPGHEQWEGQPSDPEHHQ